MVSCPVRLDKGHFSVSSGDSGNVSAGTYAILNCAENLMAFNGISNYTCNRSGAWVPEPGCGCKSI